MNFCSIFISLVGICSTLYGFFCIWRDFIFKKGGSSENEKK